MLKRIAPAVIIVVLSYFVFYGVPVAHAEPHKPLALFNNFARGYWLPGEIHSGDTFLHGGSTTIPYPNITHSFGNGEKWARYLVMTQNGTSGDWAYVGMVQDGTSPSFPDDCNTGGSPGVFYAIWNSTLTTLLAHNCFNGFIGDSYGFQISWFASNGGGTFFWINDLSNSSNSDCTPCSYGSGTSGETFGSVQLREDVLVTFTGTLISKQEWTANQGDDQAGTFVYATSNFHSKVAGNPPQMNWDVVPASGNFGGSLGTCEKDSGSLC